VRRRPSAVNTRVCAVLPLTKVFPLASIVANWPGASCACVL
jgi:hypothetical protein